MKAKKICTPKKGRTQEQATSFEHFDARARKPSMPLLTPDFEKRLEDGIQAALPNFARSSKTDLPNPPLLPADSPEEPPEIKQVEITEYLDAEHRFQIALADRDERRARLTMKLLQMCEPEPGSTSIKLDRNWSLVVTHECLDNRPGLRAQD